jgi:hypothetical protein
MMRKRYLTFVRILSIRLGFALLFRYIDKRYIDGSLPGKHQNTFPGSL